MRKVLLAILLVASSSSQAEVLWGKAQSGSSVDELKSLYPNGSVVAPDDRQTLRSGAKLGFRIDNVDINGHSFRADFYLKDNSLQQVTLKGELSGEAGLCDAAYSSIHSQLSGKYGAAVSVNGSRPSRGISQSTFSKDGIVISTYALGAPSGCSIMIFYKGNSSGSAANL